jgi:hypothetical protein
MKKFKLSFFIVLITIPFLSLAQITHTVEFSSENIIFTDERADDGHTYTKVSLFDLSKTDEVGKLVYQTTLENKQGQYVWDTRNMSSGLYHYSLKTTHGIKSGKVTVIQ